MRHRAAAGWPATLYLSLSGVLAGCALSSSAVANHKCLLGLAVNRAGETGYRERAGRCEGVYPQPIAERVHLRLLGYHAAEPAFELASAKLISFEIAAARSGGDATDGLPFVLRAISMRERLNYQLDTTVPGGQPVFLLDTALLRHPDIALSQREVAVLACRPDCTARPQSRYFPVSLAAGTARQLQRPVAIFAVSTELLRWHLRRRRNDESSFVEVSSSNERVHSNEPFYVPMAAAGPGMVEIQLLIETPDGGMDTFNGFFFVPAP